MSKGRLEAFSDGVIAILITIMVLELKVPRTPDLGALRPVLPVLLTYVMSFVFLGIYWNNHHHLLQATERINGTILWANLHLLFWLSLVPFVTGWNGREPLRSIADRHVRRGAASVFRGVGTPSERNPRASRPEFEASRCGGQRRER
jgi:uncharacterized membrane protein